MPITFSLPAIDTPTPLQPQPEVIGQPSLPFTQGGSAPWIGLLNQLVSIIGAIGGAGAGGYAVVFGATPTQTTGLNIEIGTGLLILGYVNGFGPYVELVNGGSPQGFQQQTPAPRTLDDNTTNYVWVTQDPASGAIGLNHSVVLGTIPANGVLPIAIVTTLGGTITAIDQSGVIFLKGNQLTRQTADVATPGDTPPATMRLLTETSSLNYQWDGTSHKALVDLTKQFPASVNVQTISITLALTKTSANNQYLTASGGSVHVTLPDPTTLPLGWTVAIFNAGASNNVLLYDHTNTTPVATITPGQAISFGTLWVSGAVAFPGGSYNPGSPTPGVPAGPV